MLIQRYTNNPILTKDDVPYPVATVHNAGVVKYNNRYIMLFRSHTLNGRSILGKAESTDGFSFTVDKEPFMLPAKDGIFREYEEYGVEDPRIVFLEGEFLITYSAYSRHGVRIGLAKTNDFKTIERFSLITEADYRNVVIFPARFNGLYARLDRPHSEISGYVHNVVFTCGAIAEEDGSVKIYWGGADKVMCVGTANLEALVDHCLQKPREAI